MRRLVRCISKGDLGPAFEGLALRWVGLEIVASCRSEAGGVDGEGRTASLI
jgi:hypothetical protein